VKREIRSSKRKTRCRPTANRPEVNFGRKRTVEKCRKVDVNKKARLKEADKRCKLRNDDVSDLQAQIDKIENARELKSEFGERMGEDEKML
jgi:hypothetical protein